MAESDSNPIEKIRARLDGGNRWHKGSMYDKHGRACLMGACIDVRVDYALLASPIREQYTDRLRTAQPEPGTECIHPIASFNDHADTVWSDVELVLDKASLRWEESRAGL